MAKKVVTGEVRFSYANLIYPRGTKWDDTPKYSTEILIPKDDLKTVNAINEAVDAAAKEKFGDKLPRGFNHPLRDPELEAEENGERCAAAEVGMYRVRVKSNPDPDGNRQFGVVDNQLNPITQAKDLKSGDYGRISMNAVAYDVSGNRGVSFWINNVQKLRSGEALGGQMAAEDEFDAVDSDDWDDVA